MVELKPGVGTGNGASHILDGAPLAHDAEMAWQEAQGASQIGPFDFVPPMGFREYWYPAVLTKKVGPRKPVALKMLGEDIVFFRGKGDKVYALFDWCPHRSARLSQGESVFPGTITCEYHGYTMYKHLWYILWRKPNTIVRINEWEDLVTFQKDRLRYDLPQKLSTLDTNVIYFRRHLARRSRDFQRLGGAYGSAHPPTRGSGERKESVAADVGDS